MLHFAQLLPAITSKQILVYYFEYTNFVSNPVIFTSKIFEIVSQEDIHASTVADKHFFVVAVVFFSHSKVSSSHT